MSRRAATTFVPLLSQPSDQDSRGRILGAFAGFYTKSPKQNSLSYLEFLFPKKNVFSSSKITKSEFLFPHVSTLNSEKVLFRDIKKFFFRKTINLCAESIHSEERTAR